jgi:hypothetical protein
MALRHELLDLRDVDDLDFFGAPTDGGMVRDEKWVGGWCFLGWQPLEILLLG